MLVLEADPAVAEPLTERDPHDAEYELDHR
jgi:hypothetical protein